MPSHIFARLGLWQDDIDSNLASIAATRKTAAMHMGGEGHQFHAMSFLEVAYLQSGREAEAEALIEEVKRMPAMKDMYGTGYDPRFYALSDFPALYALELHRWAAAASLVPVPQARSDDSATTYWARAIGSARSGHPSEALKDVEQMERIRATLRAEKKASSASAIDQDRTEALAWIEHAQSKNEEATKALRTIAEKQESTGGEAEEEIPAREMLADMLLEMNRPQQALAEYELDLKFNPNRFNGLYGAARSAELAGLADQSASYYAQLVKVCEGSNSDRAELRRAKELLASK
jgi:tetratricopeptide (TPR) repeat protein